MTAAQLSVEVVARRLCLAAGLDPDMLVYRGEPFVIDTGAGRVRAMYGAPLHLWRCYEPMASAVLADIAAGRLG